MTFQAFPKIDRFVNETATITEKIDGTNACIYFTNDHGSMVVQSRRRLITPADDNAGFARWACENADELFSLLGPGRHFGEWWGRGIQRRYDRTRRHFSLFNTHVWPQGRQYDVGGATVAGVPVLGVTNMPWLSQAAEDALELLRTEGSQAAPGYMNPEGCMIFLHRLGRYLKHPLDGAPKSAVGMSWSDLDTRTDGELVAA